MTSESEEVEMKDDNTSMEVELNTSEAMIHSILQDEAERQRVADSLIKRLEEEERVEEDRERVQKDKQNDVGKRWEHLISMAVETAAIASNTTRRKQANSVFSCSSSSFSSVPELYSDSENSLFPNDDEDYYSLKALTKKIPLLEHLLQVDLDRRWVTDEDEEPEGIVEITPSDLKPCPESEKPVVLVFGSEGQGKTQLLRHVQKKFLYQEAKPPEPTPVAILSAMKATPPPPHSSTLPVLPHNPPIWLYVKAHDLYTYLSSSYLLPLASPSHSSPSLPSLSTVSSNPAFSLSPPLQSALPTLSPSSSNSNGSISDKPFSLSDIIVGAASEALEESERKKNFQNELRFFIKQERRKCILLIDDLETLSSLQLTSFLTILLNFHAKQDQVLYFARCAYLLYLWSNYSLTSHNRSQLELEAKVSLKRWKETY